MSNVESALQAAQDYADWQHAVAQGETLVGFAEWSVQAEVSRTEQVIDETWDREAPEEPNPHYRACGICWCLVSVQDLAAHAEYHGAVNWHDRTKVSNVYDNGDDPFVT